MATYAQDFATKWELEAQNKRDLETFDKLSDQLIALGMTSARHGVMFNQKDKHRLIAIMEFRDPDAFKNCMNLIEGTDWNREINRVERLESYVIDAKLNP
tara:strand:+ start:147 stop:446 length:300 start_codon:yes stop_codon:yes gene_type:complete